MIRTYKRKLILTKSQERRIASWIGTCRFVYNMALDIQIQSYKAHQKKLNKFDLMKQLTEIKDFEWIADVPSQSLQNVIERLDRSYQNFFKNYKLGVGFPKFAKKDKYRSILLKSVKVNQHSILLPKLGKIRMFKDSEIEGNAKTAIIIKEPTGYFICIQCEDVPKKFVSESQTIGLDMGISHFCIDSKGNFIANPKHFKNYERKLRIKNRSISRKKKGSNRWKKQVEKLAKLHHKIGNVRKDFLHKESTKIAKLHSTVYMEKLNIKSMSKNKQLSKHILDCGWGMFRVMLQYKTSVVLVNPKYTSQTCSECGEVDKKSRLNQSEFVCTSCGHISNADYNAAKNILSRGTALSRKREPIGCALTLES